VNRIFLSLLLVSMPVFASGSESVNDTRLEEEAVEKENTRRTWAYPDDYTFQYQREHSTKDSLATKDFDFMNLKIDFPFDWKYEVDKNRREVLISKDQSKLYGVVRSLDVKTKTADIMIMNLRRQLEEQVKGRGAAIVEQGDVWLNGTRFFKIRIEAPVNETVLEAQIYYLTEKNGVGLFVSFAMPRTYMDESFFDYVVSTTLIE
jgi:hypothetical protein